LSDLLEKFGMAITYKTVCLKKIIQDVMIAVNLQKLKVLKLDPSDVLTLNLF